MVQITKEEARLFQVALTTQTNTLQQMQYAEYKRNGASDYWKLLVTRQKESKDLIQDLYKRISQSV